MDIDLCQQDPTNFSVYEQVLGDTALFPMASFIPAGFIYIIGATTQFIFQPDSHAGYGIGTSSHHDHSINIRFSDVDK